MPKRHKEPRLTVDSSRPLLPPDKWPPGAWQALHRAAQHLGELRAQKKAESREKASEVQ